MSVRLVAALFSFFLCIGTALSQTTEAELKSRLVGKSLYLRGFWREDSLHFDSDGRLIGKSGVYSFTLCGVDVKKVHLGTDSLVLEGKRVGTKFKGNTPSRVVLLVGDQPPFNDEMLQITIDRPSDGDFSHALAPVFADGLVELVPSLPPYWQRFAREGLLPGSSVTFTPGIASANGTATTVPVKKVGGEIKAPVLLKPSEPEFSYAARNLRYSGKTLVNLWVDANGIPSHLTVAKPAGLGLDEQALYSVQQYRFKPATENGQPVVVELNVEVNFEIY